MPNLRNDQPVLAQLVASSVSGGMLITQSAKDFLTANPRVNAALTITVGGTITNGEICTITFTCGALPAGVLAVTATAATSDSLAMLAEKIVAAINNSPTLQNMGIYATAGGALGAVVTINLPGPVGNLFTITTAVSGTASETLTRSPAGGVPTGGSGPVIPISNFDYVFAGQQSTYAAGYPQFVDPLQLIALVRDGQPII